MLDIIEKLQKEALEKINSAENKERLNELSKSIEEYNQLKNNLAKEELNKIDDDKKTS